MAQRIVQLLTGLALALSLTIGTVIPLDAGASTGGAGIIQPNDPGSGSGGGGHI